MTSAGASCGLCRRKLRAQGAKTGNYYREVSNVRGFTDCAASGRGTRMEYIDAQVGAIFRELRLPLEWREELETLVDEQDEDYETLNSRRARLKEERRRLKRMKVKGEFDEDPDIYEQELARIKRQMAELPTKGDYETMERAALMLERLAEVWDDAELVDRRNLLRLAVREVKIDVVGSRLATIEPYPVFVPLFRRVPQLRELDFGVFAPVWYPGNAKELPKVRTLKPIREYSKRDKAYAWPLVTRLPKKLTGKRINPLVSKWLKARRKAEEPFEALVDLSGEVPFPLKVDGRKWPVEVREPETLADLEDGSAAFLWSPFRVQELDDLGAFVSEVKRVLMPGGTWQPEGT